MKKRFIEYDYLKVCAIISVVLIHTTSNYIYQSRIALLINQFSRFAVPLFILLSGLLLNISNSKTSLLIFYQKRAKKIILPFIIWTTIYIIITNLNNIKMGEYNLKDFILALTKGLIWGNGYYHLYFMTVIIQLYLLYPFLKIIIAKYPYISLITSFIVTFIYQIAVYFQILNIIKLPWSPLPYYEFFPTWIFFFVFGMFLAQNIANLNKMIIGKTRLLGAIWLLSFIILLIDSKITNIYDSIRPSIIIYCVTSFLFGYKIFINFDPETSLSNVISWLSRQSFFIYLSHSIFIYFSVALITSLSFLNHIPLFINFALLFIGTNLLTVIFAYLLSKTSIFNYCGGVINKIKSN